MNCQSSLSPEVRWRRLRPLGYLIIIGGVFGTVTADTVAPSSDEILARIESEANRRHVLLKEYSGSRQYTLQNSRFGRRAAVDVLMNYRQVEGERYTVLTRSGSDSLNGVINKVLASETAASLPPESALHQISSANYRVRLLGTEVAAGRSCYVLELTPKIKSRYLIAGKAWVDPDSYGVVRLEGQFAASSSVLIGAPSISEEFIEVQGFWLPGHVRSITSSLLLGPTQMDILFSNYQLGQVFQIPVAAVPNSAPTPAVAAMARAPQKVTRIAPIIMPAPPACAANAPRSARNNSEVPATKGIRAASGTMAVTTRGMAAPTAKLAADAKAA
jgi:hypothetical protein